MFCGKWIIGGSDGFDQIAAIREAVFVKEQGIDPSIVFDSIDEAALHALIFEGSFKEIDSNIAPFVAAGRLYAEEGQWRIGRICVLKEHRGKGYGEVVTRMLCGKAFDLAEDRDIILHAQASAKSLYEKVGFIEEGKPYLEADIEHISMRLKESDFGGLCNHS